MIGTILNAAGIILGGVIGLTLSRQPAPSTQFAMKGLLGVVTVYVGLRLTWMGLGGGFWMVGKQLIIVVLALMLGRIVGRLLRLQKSLNRLGRYAKERFAAARPDNPQRFGEGFTTCTVLFCLGPLAILGSIQDGLDGQWQALAVKAVMDGLAAMAFVSAFGWGVIVSAIPVLAYQGTVTLLTQAASGFLRDHGLLDSINATSGLLVFCVALIILELKKVELTDYLPSLVFAPLLTWIWK
jgi:uncharacterized membrane protein YqgA involved in biofilm formation